MRLSEERGSTEASRPNVKVKRKFDIKSFVSVILLQIGALYAIWYWYAYGYSWRAWLTFGVFYLISSAGISIGYHRYFTHNSFQCSRTVQVVLAVSAAFALQGPIIDWVTIHMTHHAHVEQPGKDPHTPKEYSDSRSSGIKTLLLAVKSGLWAHMAWVWYEVLIPEGYTPPDRQLKENPIARWQQRWYWSLVVLSFVMMFLMAGWEGMLLAGIFRIVFCHHSTWAVNSLGHIVGFRAKYPDGAKITRDGSRNNPFLTPITFGEINHGNHHKDPNCAFFGRLDPGRWLLVVGESLGIIRHIKRPKINIAS